MLFDLRARGRRRTVQVVYIGLAIIFLLGFVGFGVGGGFSGGGVLSGLSGNEGSSKASFSSEVKKYQKLTREQPGNVVAWEKLVRVQLKEAGGEAYIQNNQLTSKGRELFSQVASSWNSYLALNPPKPSPELAQEMVRVLGEEGLNQPSGAVQALQIVVAAHPTSPALYGALAEYAYKAHNVREGDLASEKAVSLAPAAQRLLLKTKLAAVKKSASGEPLTATGAGKTYALKPGATGHYTATPTTSTQAPAGQSPSTKK
jgi:hypothetical protein